jgi:ribose transport system ATP-binding protein
MKIKDSTVSHQGLYDVEVSQLKKSFGPNRVLKGISLTIGEGEFVGLVGPNGAGKSTLIKILDGVYRASNGEIKIGGRLVRSLAESREVGFIHQDLGLVDALTIAENFTLGRPSRKRLGVLLDKHSERSAAKQALARVGLARSADTQLGDLTVGEKALVAVAKLLDRGAKVLVIDETTSTLPPADANLLLKSLKAASADGATVIMVSHKLAEILDVTDRVLALVEGHLVADAPTAGLDRAALVKMLMQHEGSLSSDPTAADAASQCLVELREVRIGKLRAANLKLHAGEVLGISGMPGSGLHDVAYVVNGNLDPEGGSVALLRPGLRRALVPPHRESQGGFSELTVRENMGLSALRRWRRGRCLVDRRRETGECEAIMEELSVQPPSLDSPFGVLSGGNKQKVIFGRALLSHPDVYVLCEPTRGVDVGTRSEIYRLIRALARDGAGVLVASSDAEDLFSVCDRAAVIADGTLGKARQISELKQSELELMV